MDSDSVLFYAFLVWAFVWTAVAVLSLPSDPDLDPQQVTFADHCLKSGMQPQIKGQFVVCKPKQEK